MLLLLGCEDRPKGLIMPDNVDISVTDNGVVPVPSDVDPILISIFSRYSKVVAPNGKPIHIFAQSEVSDQQIIRARDILGFYLTDVPKLIYGRKKNVVANAMANRSASLLFFNNESSRKYAFEEFALADLNIASQNLHATEFFVEGSIDYANNPPERQDASFKDILHLVQKYGIIPSLTDYQSEILTSANNARSAGIWVPTDDDNDAIADLDDSCEQGDIGWTSNALTDHDTDGCQDASDEDLDDDNDSQADDVDDCQIGDLGWTSDSNTDYDDDGCQDSSDEDADDDNDLSLIHI